MGVSVLGWFRVQWWGELGSYTGTPGSQGMPCPVSPRLLHHVLPGDPDWSSFAPREMTALRLELGNAS